MKCTDVQKNLLAFIDNDCDTKNSRKVKDHLEFCNECQAEHQKVLNFFEKDLFDNNMESPYLWTRIQAQISDFETSKAKPSGFFEKIPRFAINVGICLLLLIALKFGAFLGSPSQSEVSELSDVSSLRDRYTLFESLPSKSLGDAYLSVSVIDEEDDNE